MSAFWDLSDEKWELSGWTPNLWLLGVSMETRQQQKAEFLPMPARVPCSVQGVLRDAGILPDWHVGFNARLCEWVENRHWCFSCNLSCQLDPDCDYELVLPGVDDKGWVYYNGVCLGEFNGAHRPHQFQLPHDHRATRLLEIYFDTPVRFAGQFGRTPDMPVTKPRFYYTWDWIPRMVQIGITQAPYLRNTSAPQFAVTEMWTNADARQKTGSLRIKGTVCGAEIILLELKDGPDTIWSRKLAAGEFERGITAQIAGIELWHPNLSGTPQMYDFIIDCGAAGREVRRIGFKQIRWLPCQNSPAGADPWLCEINGHPVFLQGFNWTPVRAFYADLKPEDYRSRLESYRQMGCNILRIWGGAFLEPDYFYEMCDEMGLLVWQEFPLSSSGISNTPPYDGAAIAEMRRIAEYYFTRVSPHVSLLAWSGGNELQRGENGSEDGCGYPCNTDEPILGMLSAISRLRDPHRRFMATSASGPFEFGDPKRYGKGELWEVHGPWKCDGRLEDQWFEHWDRDDSLFRAEFGCPGASGAELIEKYAGAQKHFPCSTDVAWWRYPLAWWSEQNIFEQEFGRGPESVAEYVAWSQERQAKALAYAVSAMKARFPSCGGAIIWMGHDSFPCSANTSVIDFEGKLKPAATALADVFHDKR